MVVDTGTAAYPSLYFSQNEMFVCYWADPDPNQVVWCGPNSHLCWSPTTSTRFSPPSRARWSCWLLALLGVLAYAWRKRSDDLEIC